ncbi:MAG: amidohydrolase, partial [Proteobacteria bacterium]|nr:amidohydrolase [Pseudomonadota bacterium]
MLVLLAWGVLSHAEPFDSTYAPVDSSPTLIRDVTILTATQEPIDRGYVFFDAGVIVAYGSGDVIEELLPLDGATIIDGSGSWLTPGLIDVHSHLGDYPSPDYPSNSDGNESTSPVTPQVWAEH